MTKRMQVTVVAVALALGAVVHAAEKSTDAILDELALGTTPKEAIALVGELGKRKEARAQEALELYAKNRTPEVRKAALEALAGFGNERSGTLLLDGLSDSSPEVRAFAAQALARRKVPGTEQRYLRLLEKGDPIAPTAVAAIATPELAHRLSEKLGQLPDGALASTFGEILKRADFTNEKVRSEIIKTLSKMPGADSTVALQEYVSSTAKDPKRPSRIEAEKIIEQRSK